MSEVETGYVVGQPIILSATFRDQNGVPTDTTVVLTVWDPDEVASSPTPAHPATGVYTYALLTTMSGIYRWKFVGSGAIDAADSDSVYVRPETIDVDYTYDLATNVGKVRLYIDDRDLTSVAPSTPRERRSAIFDDAEINQFLSAEAGSIYRASAVALTTIATNRSLLVQKRDIDGAVVDYGSLRKDLLDAADKWLKRADEEAGGDESPADGVAEINWNDFTERRIVVNAQLRGDL